MSIKQSFHSDEYRTERFRTHRSTPRNCTSRRDLLKLMAAGMTFGSISGWLKTLAAETAKLPERKRSCILLWMTGGPSQTDTFDMKPDHPNGGPFKAIETSVPGIHISEHLPKLAKQMQHVTLIRSMQTREGDHSRATFHMRTGYLPQGPIHYPTLGSLISNELGQEESELPDFVSIAPYRDFSEGAFGPGFLGPKRAPLIVGESRFGRNNPNDYEQALQVQNISLHDDVTLSEADSRLDLLRLMESGFEATHPGIVASSHTDAYRQAVRMMRSEAVKAFDLVEEPDKLRDAYGRNHFGQSCLLARRLVEKGVPFVEISLNSVRGNQGFGWDTHSNNFDRVKALSEVLDPGWATLIEDLDSRGLLDSTMIVWMGEFGRTPRINRNQGRDHFPTAWSTVLCGGGFKTGQTVGETNSGGTSVKDRPVTVPDFLATICGGLGIDHRKQNMSNVGRPIRIVDPDAKPIEEILS